MDENKNLNENGELLENAPEENTMKVDFNSIESTESGIALEDRFGEAQEYDDYQSAPAAAQPVVPANQEYIGYQAPAQEVPAPQIPVQQPVQPAQQPAKKAKKKVDPEVKKAKKAKRKKNFGVFIRIFIITILSVVTLWTVAYTVDHVLAAQGYTPIFVLKTEKYDIAYLVDENAILESNNQEKMYAYSYECLGYKVQHIYDENCDPKVDFAWAWEKGAVDELYDRGELFKEAAE